ncbi:Anaphase-promoting complex subunit 1 [Yamadazyma tenuis]|uniref:Anaphase-promoting complex subunit 1 middle domain-containing protein n=1 Tax=Candida tenuis (strain ATCC 10573 / BCRC 21748 / CBS 615 / JCM 9827 / NBRC 10315 / NRRL Y-1498 / VKM Y-70) TaxID=590646 RepID=G3B9A2_CANTC|nr:uncharacterized protein CANTEDRAFT_125075 [Yamadazyma tenuis ATCC 10573]EGV61847.1 hypothetical protein CANTEDRAFT_125075 [Yamadazyma tenuis ATCC 10573]WEJ93076.1 Anaphase-promoting complex subunit 1 [Yamadazyma tenuis]
MTSSPTPDQLSSPAIDLKYLRAYTSSGGQTKLFPGNKHLVIHKREVLLVNGASLSKKFTFDEDVVTATFTCFTHSESLATESEPSLVICLAKSAFIYTNGKDYTVSFPFVLRSALPFEFGLLLEKGQLQTYPSESGINSATFLSLVDPIGEFRVITSSSTSTISPYEEMVAFPLKGLNKTSSLCATYNRHDKVIVIYHIRTSNKNNGKRLNSFKYSKRKNTFLTTPNPARILEDESLHIDYSNGNMSNHMSITSSINMEKKRTSTLLSDASSMARMGSESSISELSKPMEMALKKDMILTRVEVLSIQVDRKNLDIYNLCYEEQEAIIIMNRYKKEAKVYIFNQSITAIPQYQSTYSIKCLHCVPLMNSEFPGYIVVLRESNVIQILNPFVDVTSAPITLSGQYPTISGLQCACDEDIALIGSDGDTFILKLVMKPSSDIVLKCLQCFKYLSGSNISETIWTLWRTALMLDDYKDDWWAFVVTILAILLPMDSEVSNYELNEITVLLPLAKKLNEQLNDDYLFREMLPYIAISLHLIREEAKLDVLAHDSLDKIGLFLTQLCTWMGWPEAWCKYYMVDINKIDGEPRMPSVFVIPQPPNILESLSSLFNDSIVQYLTFSQLVEESFAADELIIPRTHAILKLFELIVSPNYGPNNVVDLMCELGFTIQDLETFPLGVRVPLKEAISYCQENPDFQWNPKALDLVGRKELNMFLRSGSYQPPTSLYTQFGPNTNQLPRDINHILSGVLDGTEQVSAWDDQSEADRIGITKLIFDHDRRYYEITSLLHQTKAQTATLITEEGKSDFDVVVLQRALAAIVALRTLSIPLGRASLYYGGRMPLLTEKFPIPKFNLNTVVAPKMTNIVLHDGAVDEKVIEWGYFHNGVAAGLSISKQSKGISGSWIIFNKPPSLNAQHAGFLLGLGLNGHLKNLEEWHIYNYLGPKHPLTSVGLLVGMAASNMGTMNIKLTKVLSVHAVALLPQGANDLNVPVMVQTAGLLGIGLLYLESQHRRMSETLLAQITSTVSQNDSEQIHEGYRLAAGISLGFVNLGKGKDLKGLNDTRVVDRLLALATSMKDYQPVQELDKSCSGAIMALGFIHMKTEDVTIANKLGVPQSEQLLDYIRPDLLLLRCVSKNIIMWSSVNNTRGWVESQIPESLLARYGKGNADNLDSDQICYYNVLGGTCLSIAIKYASTHDKTARDTLLHYLDQMMVVAMTPTEKYDQKITCNAATNIQNLLALSISVVMAGSGDLETFRRLRVLYGDTSKDTNYGNYMAINMALGFLFLGGGQYAFGNSNLAIASLIVSLYPVFPNNNSEYEVHLQALRHFWAISVDPRCLIVRDVDTHKPSKIPVTLRLRNGQVKKATSPCLLPSLSSILSIQTDSLDHFKVRIDFGSNPDYLEIFKKALTLFVYKRQNYQMLKSSVKNLLEYENRSLQVENNEVKVDKDIEKILSLNFMKPISAHEKKVYLYESSSLSNDTSLNDLGLSVFIIIDTKLELQRVASNPKAVDDLMNLKLIFSYSDKLFSDDMRHIPLEFVEMLKHSVWELTRS